MPETRPVDDHRTPPTQVLLVEPEPQMREVMARALDGAGFSVLLDPRDAFRRARRSLRGGGGGGGATPPAAVLVAEVDHPASGGVDGLVLAEAARRRWPGIGVVFVTGRRPSRLDGRALGRHDRFLAKPVAAVTLVRTVRALAAR